MDFRKQALTNREQIISKQIHINLFAMGSKTSKDNAENVRSDSSSKKKCQDVPGTRTKTKAPGKTEPAPECDASSRKKCQDTFGISTKSFQITIQNNANFTMNVTHKDKSTSTYRNIVYCDASAKNKCQDTPATSTKTEPPEKTEAAPEFDASSKKKCPDAPCTSTKSEAPEKTETAPEFTCWSQTSNTVGPAVEEPNRVAAVISQKQMLNLEHKSPFHGRANTVGPVVEEPNRVAPVISIRHPQFGMTIQNSGNLKLNVTKNVMGYVSINQFDLFGHETTITDKPRTPIDEKDCDSTQSTSKTSEDEEKYRFSVEICLEELVEQFVKKSGKVMSPESVSAIYNRLTNKIWAEIRGDIDKIPLKKLKNFHKVIFKALCKRWKDPELILEIMESDIPRFDDKIVDIFIEEAAKLSKKPGCIRRFFSFIGRLFCCTRRQNKVDVM